MTQKKKILVIYATAGIGHKKASLAIKKALDEIAPADVEVAIIDALDYTNRFFKWSYLKAYLLMVNSLPLLWGFSYYLTDFFLTNLIVSRLRRFNNWLNSKRLVRYLLESKPDVIISTHFFASEIISNLKKKASSKTRLVTVITDYRLHPWWVADSVDVYIAGSEDVAKTLARWGVASSKIMALGIPIEPAFSKRQDKEAILKRSGLESGVFTVLVIGGGFGVGPIEDILKTINGISGKVQMIAICGHNDELVKRLEGLKRRLKARIKVLGFVDNVYEYMEISDILISKSGGITVAESLAKELPMVIISPIIGQETGNSSFLVRHSAGIAVGRTADLKGVIDGLVRHPEKIEQMREAIRRIKKPSACYDIARLAIEMAAQPGKP